MATNTQNYNFNKPLQTDYYDIEVQNNNWDLADSSLKNLDTLARSIQTNTENNKISISRILNVREVTLDKDSWLNASGMFIYSIQVSGIKASDNVSLVKIIDTSTASTLAKLKEYNKNFSYIVGGNTEQGSIGLVAIKRPSIDLKVGVKGV